MRANRKSKPQHKMIFAISAMFTTSAMFAQCKEGFPLGGKKTASSLSRKRLMRANRKGKPQFKDIFDISAMYATFAMFAMFAQCKEGVPLGGSCRVSD